MLPTSHVSKKLSERYAKLGRAIQECLNGYTRRSLLVAASLGLLVGGPAGCTTLHNGYEAMANNGAWSEVVSVLRNRSMSAKAWHRRKHHFGQERFNKDFQAGFRAGYEDVAEGKDGCTPNFAPQKYWSWEYQSAEGQARTAAWFSGYPHGARAAEEEGVGHWNHLQMSPATQSMFDSESHVQHEGALHPIPGDPNGLQDGSTPGRSPDQETLPPEILRELPPGAQLIPNPDDAQNADSPDSPAVPMLIP